MPGHAVACPVLPHRAPPCPTLPGLALPHCSLSCALPCPTLFPALCSAPCPALCPALCPPLPLPYPTLSSPSLPCPPLHSHSCPTLPYPTQPYPPPYQTLACPAFPYPAVQAAGYIHTRSYDPFADLDPTAPAKAPPPTSLAALKQQAAAPAPTPSLPPTTYLAPASAPGSSYPRAASSVTPTLPRQPPDSFVLQPGSLDLAALRQQLPQEEATSTSVGPRNPPLQYLNTQQRQVRRGGCRAVGLGYRAAGLGYRV